MKYHNALFFDIDGTIISEKTHTIPESAIKAIQTAGNHGCLTFINTGRTYAFVPTALYNIAFDGFLCGCGTHIVSRLPQPDTPFLEIPNLEPPAYMHTLYHREILHQEALEIIEAMAACNVDGILEGTFHNYFNPKPSRFPQIHEILTSIANNVIGTVRLFDDPDIHANKFVVWTDENSDTETFFQFIKSKHYDIIDRRFGFYEMVPAHHSKATAITFILEKFGLTTDHAYVFGDSANDLPMFTCVQNTIAMGEHDPILDPYTSFVTKTVEENGIAHALKHFHLIP